MDTENDFSDPDDYGDRTHINLRNVAGRPDVSVWNLSGQPLKVQGNRGFNLTNLKSEAVRPRVSGQGVQDRYILDSFSDEKGVDWAIISLEVTEMLKATEKLPRAPESSRIIVIDDTFDEFPKGLNGRMAMPLFLLGFRVWTITNRDERAALDELDSASIDAQAITI